MKREEKPTVVGFFFFFWCCKKLIDSATVLKDNSHGFFFPSEPLLPSDECLHRPAELLTAHVVFSVIFLTRVSVFHAFLGH